MPEGIPREPEIESMHLETPVIEVGEKITPQLHLETRDDEGDLEEAIAAIERLERAMRSMGSTN